MFWYSQNLVIMVSDCPVLPWVTCNLVSSATLPAGLLPSFYPCPSEHGQGSLEQHAHTCCKKENFVWFHWDLCVPHKLNSFVHLLAIAYTYTLYIYYITPVNLYNYICVYTLIYDYSLDACICVEFLKASRSQCASKVVTCRRMHGKQSPRLGVYLLCNVVSCPPFVAVVHVAPSLFSACSFAIICLN